ncbi:MAG: acyl-CoA dehydrogenase family protein, partial [Myxococcales bacterium]|nr:acyl-CoA dehydrogenase family protein [Myxococcales bacterium]
AHALGESLAAILPLSRLHVQGAESPKCWAALQELGVLSACAPEAEGGGGLGAVEEALIALELGRCAAAPSVFATMGAAHVVGADAARPSGPGRVAAGYRRGHRTLMVEDPEATMLLVRDETETALFEPVPVGHVVDDGLWAVRLSEVSGLGRPVAMTEEQGTLRLRLLEAAALAGLACAAQEMAVSYAGERKQFGRPIGSFQAVKHHCANMALAARGAADLVSFAAVAVESGRVDATLQVESALFVAASAARDNCGKNIQVHGAMGFSDEADPHLLLKRARIMLAIAGGLEPSLRRIAACPPTGLSALAEE